MKSSKQFLYLVMAIGLISGIILSPPLAAAEQSQLKMFGFFQTQFFHIDDQSSDLNSFSMQNLNLFLQKKLSPRWKAFVNFEFINSFSTENNTGDFNLQEAWVRYRYNRNIDITIGRQIPEFNHFNKIKNRTPLLPYAVRPLVYENSMADIISNEDYVPQESYIEVNGFFPLKKWKFDFAAYIGNSPNILTKDDETNTAPTGVDTTDNFLFGTRLGMRYDDLKLGVSLTGEKMNFPLILAQPLNTTTERLIGIPRYRIGLDLSYLQGRIFFENEFIRVLYYDDIKELDIDQTFFYTTLGYWFTERFFFYGSLWINGVNGNKFTYSDPLNPDTLVHEQLSSDLFLPTAGFTYSISDQIKFKGQYTWVKVDLTHENGLKETQRQQYYVAALSVMF